jgi:hypothetical protein
MQSRESKFVRETQVDPVAGIWACDNCGRRIQVITASDTPKVQSFICVCGKEMRPGEEHVVFDVDSEGNTTGRVVDD